MDCRAFIGEIKHLGMLGEHSKRPKITRYARDFFRPFFVFSQHPRVLYFTDKRTAIHPLLLKYIKYICIYCTYTILKTYQKLVQ